MRFRLSTFSPLFLLNLSFSPMQKPVAIRAQRDALLYFLHRPFEATICHKLVHTLLVRVSDHMVKVDQRGVLYATVGAFLRRFERVPLPFSLSPVLRRLRNMTGFVLLVMTLLVYGLLDALYLRVFVWH